MDDEMLQGYVKYLFDSTRISPRFYELYLSAVFSRLGAQGIRLPEGKGWRRVVLGCQQLTPEDREQRPPLLPSHYLPQLAEMRWTGGQFHVRLSLLVACNTQFFGWRATAVASIRVGCLSLEESGHIV